MHSLITFSSKSFFWPEIEPKNENSKFSAVTFPPIVKVGPILYNLELSKKKMKLIRTNYLTGPTYVRVSIVHFIVNLRKVKMNSTHSCTTFKSTNYNINYGALHMFMCNFSLNFYEGITKISHHLGFPKISHLMLKLYFLKFEEFSQKQSAR